jgi:hypothetical protein
MNDDNHKAKSLNFGGFSGYYGFMSAHNGYGGFNYLADFDYMNASTWTSPGGWGYQYNWCDTGYQNVSAAAKTTSLGWVYQFGLMETPNGHSFSLQSFLAAASFSVNQSWEVISYTESKGQLVQKATMDLSLSYNQVETVKFSGKNAKGFSNIAAVAFEMINYGSPGNSCTYGTAVYGYQMCIDDLKVKFSKKADLKHDNGKLLAPYQMHHRMGASHVAAASQIAHNEAAVHGGGPAAHHADPAYHSQLLALEHDLGLTGQFHLPAVDHLA